MPCQASFAPIGEQLETDFQVHELPSVVDAPSQSSEVSTVLLKALLITLPKRSLTESRQSERNRSSMKMQPGEVSPAPLSTLLVTLTRPVHKLSKASRRSLTPVQAPQRMSKASTHFGNPRLSSAKTVERLVHVWQPPFELHSDSRSLVDIWKRM